jgi:N-acetyl-gamma-glutamyl-phosphate reductase
MCQEIGWDLSHFTFVPHLLPINRGIISTIYVQFHQPVSLAELEAEYSCRYADKPLSGYWGQHCQNCVRSAHISGNQLPG